MITEVEGCIEEHQKTADHWKTCFYQLAALANGAIEDVPRMLAEVYATMFFYKPPKAVEVFIEHCKGLVGLMKDMVARSKD